MPGYIVMERILRSQNTSSQIWLSSRAQGRLILPILVHGMCRGASLTCGRVLGKWGIRAASKKRYILCASVHKHAKTQNDWSGLRRIGGIHLRKTSVQIREMGEEAGEELGYKRRIIGTGDAGSW